MLNYWFGRAITKAVGLGMIKVDDIHFQTDPYILSKLVASDDEEIQIYLGRCQDVFTSFEVVEDDDFDLFVTPKFRGIDPLLKLDGSFVRLTSISPSFKEEYERISDYAKKGYKIRFSIRDREPHKLFLRSTPIKK